MDDPSAGLIVGILRREATQNHSHKGTQERTATSLWDTGVQARHERSHVRRQRGLEQSDEADGCNEWEARRGQGR